MVFYTVVLDSGEEVGRYSSKSGPAAAAKKAASKRFHGSDTQLLISIRQLGTKNVYTYIATRTRLDTPFISQVGNKIITRLWKINVSAKKKQKGGMEVGNEYDWSNSAAKMFEPIQNIIVDKNASVDDVVQLLLNNEDEDYTKNIKKQYAINLATTLENEGEIDLFVHPSMYNHINVTKIIPILESICLNGLYLLSKDSSELLDLDAFFKMMDDSFSKIILQNQGQVTNNPNNQIGYGGGIDVLLRPFISLVTYYNKIKEIRKNKLYVRLLNNQQHSIQLSPSAIIQEPNIQLSSSAIIQQHSSSATGQQHSKQRSSSAIVQQHSPFQVSYEDVNYSSCEDYNHLFDAFVEDGKWNYAFNTMNRRDKRIEQSTITYVNRLKMLSLKEIILCLEKNYSKKYIEEYELYFKENNVYKKINVRFNLTTYMIQTCLLKKCLLNNALRSDNIKTVAVYLRSLLNVFPNFFYTNESIVSCTDPIHLIITQKNHENLNRNNFFFKSEWFYKQIIPHNVVNLFRQYRRGTCWLCSAISFVYLWYLHDITIIPSKHLESWKSLLDNLHIHEFFDSIYKKFDYDSGGYPTEAIQLMCDKSYFKENIIQVLCKHILNKNTNNVYIVLYMHNKHATTFFMTKTYAYFLNSQESQIIYVEYPSSWTSCKTEDQLLKTFNNKIHNKWFNLKEDEDPITMQTLRHCPYIQLTLDIVPTKEEFAFCYLNNRSFANISRQTLGAPKIAATPKVSPPTGWGRRIPPPPSYKIPPPGKRRWR